MIVYKISMPGQRQRFDLWKFKGQVKCDSFDDIKGEVDDALENHEKGIEFVDRDYGDQLNLSTFPDIDSIVNLVSGEVRLHFPEIIQKPNTKHDWSKVYFDIVVENEEWVASYFNQRIVNHISLDSVIMQIKSLLQIEPDIQSVGGYYIDWNPNPEEDENQQLLRLSKRNNNAKI